MPFKKNYSTKPKRKQYRRKNYRRFKPRFVKTMLGDKLNIKHRYFDQVTLSPGAGTNAINVYSANGLFDPNITGVGNQPRGFDQIMPLYDHYSVIYARCTVKFYSTSPVVVGIAVRDRATTVSNLDDYMEGRNIHSTMVTDSNWRTVTFSLNLSKFLGRKVLQEDDCRGSVSANPAEQAYFHIFGHSSASGGDPGLIDCQVLIDYTTVYTEPVTPGQS